jgi:hypothetical protein
MDYSEWSACEFYGHDWVRDEDNPNLHYCASCGDQYEDYDGKQ